MRFPPRISVSCVRWPLQTLEIWSSAPKLGDLGGLTPPCISGVFTANLHIVKIGSLLARIEEFPLQRPCLIGPFQSSCNDEFRRVSRRADDARHSGFPPESSQHNY